MARTTRRTALTTTSTIRARSSQPISFPFASLLLLFAVPCPSHRRVARRAPCAGPAPSTSLDTDDTDNGTDDTDHPTRLNRGNRSCRCCRCCRSVSAVVGSASRGLEALGADEGRFRARRASRASLDTPPAAGRGPRRGTGAGGVRRAWRPETPRRRSLMRSRLPPPPPMCKSARLATSPGSRHPDPEGGTQWFRPRPHVASSGAPPPTSGSHRAARGAPSERCSAHPSPTADLRDVRRVPCRMTGDARRLRPSPEPS